MADQINVGGIEKLKGWRIDFVRDGLNVLTGLPIGIGREAVFSGEPSEGTDGLHGARTIWACFCYCPAGDIMPQFLRPGGMVRTVVSRCEFGGALAYGKQHQLRIPLDDVFSAQSRKVLWAVDATTALSRLAIDVAALVVNRERAAGRDVDGRILAALDARCLYAFGKASVKSLTDAIATASDACHAMPPGVSREAAGIFIAAMPWGALACGGTLRSLIDRNLAHAGLTHDDSCYQEAISDGHAFAENLLLTVIESLPRIDPATEPPSPVTGLAKASHLLNLLNFALGRYRLPTNGIHGVGHWARVLENGLRLAETTGANLEVIRIFAILHDACRLTEDDDPGHGPRVAEMARSPQFLSGRLPEYELDLLVQACHGHTSERFHPNATVQTCWDANRLDLGRVAVAPDPAYLGTDAARDPAMIEWADLRARSRVTPDFVMTEWGLPLAVA